MDRRDFLSAIAGVLVISKAGAAGGPASVVKPVRQWKLFDVAWIEHAGMSVCVRAGTDETALWQMSEKWERVFKEQRYVPRKFVVPVRTADGMSEITYTAADADAV